MHPSVVVVVGLTVARERSANPPSARSTIYEDEKYVIYIYIYMFKVRREIEFDSILTRSYEMIARRCHLCAHPFIFPIMENFEEEKLYNCI